MSSTPCWATTGIAFILLWLTVITVKLFPGQQVKLPELRDHAWPEQWRAPPPEFIAPSRGSQTSIVRRGGLEESKSSQDPPSADGNSIEDNREPDRARDQPIAARSGIAGMPPTRPNTTLFIMCISSHTDKSKRQRSQVRKTWMDHAAIHYNASTVAIKFFVGEGGPSHDEAMQDEQNGHKDIIALDGVSDAYADLTIKVRHALQWVSTNSRALYVAKVDDDTYVNVDRLLTTLLTHPPESLYFGFSMYKQGVVRAGSKNSEPTGEGFLPDSMPSTYPPYMSGGGYVLGYDVVDIVAYPRVQPVKMLNEDAYLGIVLLQYNVNRVSTMEIFPNGIKGCKTGEQILMIHYVKANAYPCMVSMHKNVTTPGGKVCRSKSCGPVEHCEIKHPSKRCDKEITKDKSSWSQISGTAACEDNNDPPQPPKGKIVRTSYQELEGFPCCQRLCEETCGCVAVDYFWDTGWCSIYDRVCRAPKTLKDGASSHQLHRNP